MTPVTREGIGVTVVFSVIFVFGAGTVLFYNKYVPKQKVEQTSTAVVAPLPDLFKTSPLSDGNYEVFRRFTAGGTTVTCYAVFNDVKKNKTLFHTCTFTPANQPKT